MYKCECCGEIFEEPKYVQECMGEFWGTPAFETWAVCPYCEGEFEEYEEEEEEDFDEEAEYERWEDER